MVRNIGVVRSLGLVVAVLAVGCGTTSPKTPPSISITNPVTGMNLTAANGTVNGNTLTLNVTATTTATPNSGPP